LKGYHFAEEPSALRYSEKWMSTPPPASARYGYATKIRLSSELDRLLLGGHYYVWFSLELNPVQNGESSNPLLLYRQIDTAVKKNDVNHPKIKDLRVSLVDAIVRLVKPGNRGLAKSLIAQVLGAPVEMFWPQNANWGQRRLDLLGEYLGDFSILHSDNYLCSTWAVIRNESARRGRPISSADAWIAATAPVLQAPLVTNNPKDFRHLDNLQLVSAAAV
jgi:predicted nucleic acid-binding protein